MGPPASKNSSGLGRAIINRKVKEARQGKDINNYVTDLDASSKLKSVTQENDLDQFLNTAQLAGTEFVAEKENVTIVQGPSVGASSIHNPFLLSATDEANALSRHAKNKGRLRVPRRPPWTKNIPTAELERNEKDAFLDWRRQLAELQEVENFLLTPFERNLEVWRQLWRVLERSHLVVQIVDARNPLRFRCEDLESYVRDIEGAEGEAGSGKGYRKSMLLINKGELLTAAQRVLWADYFDRQNVIYAFYSALNAASTANQSDLPRELNSTGDGLSIEQQGNSEAHQAHDAYLDDEDLPPGANSEESVSEESFEDSSDDDSADKDPRIKILSVNELEEIFVRNAPDLRALKTATPSDSGTVVVGLVGYPNVGKSSTINSIIGSKKVSVSSTPGKTKHFQTIQVSSSLVLCDCPGLVFPQFATTKADLICDGVLPIDQMREYTAPTELVVQRIPREIIELSYGLSIRRETAEDGSSVPVTGEDLLISYAIARGFSRAGQGNPDEARAARYILKDYVNAKLLYCHPVPGVSGEEFNTRAWSVALRKLRSNKKKMAPMTRVGKNADTYIPPQFRSSPSSETNQLTGISNSKSQLIDGEFFDKENDLASRPFIQGSQRHGTEFSRAQIFPHQNMVADDGTPLSGRRARIAAVVASQGGTADTSGKKHHKRQKKVKQRSGKGYD